MHLHESKRFHIQIYGAYKKHFDVYMHIWLPISCTKCVQLSVPHQSGFRYLSLIFNLKIYIEIFFRCSSRCECNCFGYFVFTVAVVVFDKSHTYVQGPRATFCRVFMNESQWTALLAVTFVAINCRMWAGTTWLNNWHRSIASCAQFWVKQPSIAI